MGTRNLTCVMIGGAYKVAQYCQWDGYPSGQGIDILRFLTDTFDRELFISRLEDVKFLSDDEIHALWMQAGADEHGDGFVSMNISNEFGRSNPQLSRDIGAGVLAFIQNSTGEVPLSNQIDFAQDGLFCEWAYVVDLDKNTFEVFTGFGKTKLPEDSRFGNAMDRGYSAVGLVASYPLDELPDADTFLALENDEDE